MIFLDTSILVEILRKNLSILTTIESFGVTPLVTSEICIMELIFGLHANKHLSSQSERLKSKLSDIEKLSSKLIVLPFDHKSAFKTGEIMGSLKLSGNIIDFRDGMIACTALANGITQIFSLNISHFERIPEVVIINKEKF